MIFLEHICFLKKYIDYDAFLENIYFLKKRNIFSMILPVCV